MKNIENRLNVSYPIINAKCKIPYAYSIQMYALSYYYDQLILN